MFADLTQLLILQNRDREILDLRHELSELPKDEERARLRLSTDQAAVEAAKAANQQNEMAIKTIELDIGTRRQSLERLKNQQFETKKNDEFVKFGLEMERYAAQIDQLETSELEAMEKGDELKANLTSAKANLQESEKEVAAEIEKLHQASKERQARLQELEASRSEITEKITESGLELYERLLTKKGAQAIVPVSNLKQCRGCHVKLTPATYIQVMADKELTQCDNCGALLYPE